MEGKCANPVATVQQQPGSILSGVAEGPGNGDPIPDFSSCMSASAMSLGSDYAPAASTNSSAVFRRGFINGNPED